MEIKVLNSDIVVEHLQGTKILERINPFLSAELLL
jgi:hypothetical protein